MTIKTAKTKDKSLSQLPVAVLLFGPTASGKTGLSLPLAQQFGGEIINADSRQVYRHMPIITAMPEPHEFAAAPHHLFDFLEPDQALSAVAWGGLAVRAARDIWARNKVPFFVGGTGFYLKYLTDGLSPIPPTDSATLEGLMAEVNAVGLAALYGELEQADPVLAARLAPGDTHRIVRGLAVVRTTGVPLSVWQEKPVEKPVAARFIKLALCPPREVLYKRIHDRFDTMLSNGLVAEVEAVFARGYLPTLPALTSIGFPVYFEALEGRMSLDAAHEKVLQHMRNYAKRQTTWLRRSYHPDHVFDSADAAEAAGWLEERLASRA